ncbi:MAG TPA: DUF1707 and DUF4190 domain-containing protein [Trebonia sp.]|nr:DUF1707 and DUF4190 domain-containing protein [Trebonia sp.]
MTAGHGHPWTGGERGKMRAADADRDDVTGILGRAYSEGRLSRDEYDTRLESALSSRTYAELDHLVADLPVRRALEPTAEPATASQANTTNGLAMASLACGVAQFVFGPLATIPAIAFGHMARSQIRRSGEQGDGLALTGLVLGWGALILGTLFLIISLTIAASARAHGGAPMP